MARRIFLEFSGPRYGAQDPIPNGTETLSTTVQRKVAYRECACCGAWLTKEEKKPWGRTIPRACVGCVELGRMLWPTIRDEPWHTLTELSMEIRR